MDWMNRSGGRRANRYAFNPDYMLGLAVYYEKEQSVYTLFNWNGDLIERTVEDAVLHCEPEALASQLGNWIRNYPKIRSIAAGLPAAVRDGVIFHIPTYGAFQDYGLKSYLETLYSIPVVVGRLSATFAAIINPDAIMWCEHDLLPSTLISIKERASTYVPKPHLPEMQLRDWEQDYIAGLQRLALDMMISDTRAV
ncbi:hypothetical protein ACXFAU_17625 [Paenibacillus glucanolyticus]